MDIGANIIRKLKTNRKVFFNDIINNLTKYWTGGSYLELKRKSMVPRDRPVIYVVCKYKYMKIISFISIEDSGRKKSSIPYLYKYPDHFSDVSTCFVPRPFVMYKFFGYFDEVNSHRKSRQSDLALENYWVTRCGCLCLCMTGYMVINIKKF